MYKIDLHTHSTESPDGGLKLKDYQQVLDATLLDYIAITDHNEIVFAQAAQKHLGNRIIVGEEVMTSEGEIIGLYLTKKVNPGLNAKQTVADIKKQGGLVYIPHPFEKVRSGIQQTALDGIAKQVDIIEVYNGRALSKTAGKKALAWARLHDVSIAASSDAHGRIGWTRTYTQIASPAKKQTLVQALSKPQLSRLRVSPLGRLYPKANRYIINRKPK